MLFINNNNSFNLCNYTILFINNNNNNNNNSFNNNNNSFNLRNYTTLLDTLQVGKTDTPPLVLGQLS